MSNKQNFSESHLQRLSTNLCLIHYDWLLLQLKFPAEMVLINTLFFFFFCLWRFQTTRDVMKINRRVQNSCGDKQHLGRIFGWRDGGREEGVLGRKGGQHFPYFCCWLTRLTYGIVHLFPSDRKMGESAEEAGKLACEAECRFLFP